MAIRIEDAASAFRRAFGEAPARSLRFARAPGRVNLLGEHTDYTGGFVLPVALDFDVVIAFSRREDGVVRLYSANYDDRTQFELDRLGRDPRHPWSDYFRGVAWALRDRGVGGGCGRGLVGMDAAITGDIPEGAGLSSSAALEVASAMALLAAAGVGVDGEAVSGADGAGCGCRQTLSRAEVARLCQRAENEFVGVRCGIMDQMVSALGEAGSALFLDCRSLDFELVPLPFSDVSLVICDTGVRRGLAGSEYNRRRSECEEAEALMRGLLPGLALRSLRDVAPADFEKVRGRLPEVVARRAAHVIYENERVLRAVRALRRGDVREFGALMNESHESLRDLYEVSCEELDAMVDAARSLPGVIGARMTGAGFGGCTINLVSREAVPSFVSEVVPAYLERLRRVRGEASPTTAAKPSAFAVSAAGGARYES